MRFFADECSIATNFFFLSVFNEFVDDCVMSQAISMAAEQYAAHDELSSVSLLRLLTVTLFI